MSCSICHEDGTDADACMRACLCRGTMGNVHERCLLQFLRQQQPARSACLICGTEYRLERSAPVLCRRESLHSILLLAVLPFASYLALQRNWNHDRDTLHLGLMHCAAGLAVSTATITLTGAALVLAYSASYTVGMITIKMSTPGVVLAHASIAWGVWNCVHRVFPALLCAQQYVLRKGVLSTRAWDLLFRLPGNVLATSLACLSGWHVYECLRRRRTVLCYRAGAAVRVLPYCAAEPPGDADAPPVLAAN